MKNKSEKIASTSLYIYSCLYEYHDDDDDDNNQINDDYYYFHF